MAKSISANGLIKKAGKIIGSSYYVLPAERKELDRWDINHPWVQGVLEFFAHDTLEKILKNMEEFQIGKYNPKRIGVRGYMKDSVGDLQRSIHWTIVNASGGNETLVNFFYYKYGDYLGIDASGWLSGGKNPQFAPIRPGDVSTMTDLKGVPVENMHLPTGQIRLRPWRAKPFINSEIKRKARKLNRRLARQFCYAGGMMMFSSLIDTEHMEGVPDTFHKFIWSHIRD